MSFRGRLASLVVVTFTAYLLTSPASAKDTDGDGLLDLMDVEGFDSSANGRVEYGELYIQDLDGASQLSNVTVLRLPKNLIASIENGDFDALLRQVQRSRKACEAAAHDCDRRPLIPVQGRGRDWGAGRLGVKARR